MKSLDRLRKLKKGIKERVETFLTSEDASLSKQDLLALASTVLAGSAMSSIYAAVSHDNSELMKLNNGQVIGEHQHHSTHATHGTHASHGTHATHGTHASHNSHGNHSNCQNENGACTTSSACHSQGGTGIGQKDCADGDTCCVEN